MGREKCRSCYKEDLDENYYSLSFDKSKYLYCKSCGIDRKRIIEDLKKTSFYRDFPHFFKDFKYFSHTGAKELIKESINYKSKKK